MLASGSVLCVLIVLFGICCFASAVFRSTMFFLNMRLYHYLLKVPNLFHEDQCIRLLVASII